MPNDTLQGDTLLLYQDLSDGNWIREYCVSPVCSCVNHKKTNCDNATCRYYRCEVLTIDRKRSLGGKP